MSVGVNILRSILVTLITTATLTVSAAFAESDQNAKVQPESKPNSGTSSTAQPASDTNNKNSEVMIVLVYDDTCDRWCTQVKPILTELGVKYSGIKVVEIDASRKVIKEAKETAKKLAIANFLSGTPDYIPLVGVFRKGKLVQEITGLKSKEVYESALQKALAKK